jgi:hypothetical protein
MLYPQNSRVDPADLSNEFLKLGLRVIGEISNREILASEADEAHITRLGWRFAQYANTLQIKDSAFRKLVEQERRRRGQRKAFGRGGGFEFSVPPALDTGRGGQPFPSISTTSSRKS